MLVPAPLRPTLHGALALCGLASAHAALAQAPAEPRPAPPAAAASAPAAATPAPAASQKVEITGGRNADIDERRQSTAAKIVIGREEIDKFGDATVGEVLRRLPGVTTPGAPGRGGPPRLRGLGGGFTQLLIDGQRIPPGFSLESLSPEQIERIEILRAPTAETGARAIAGTINIITREGFKRRLNDLRLGFGYENAAFSPGLFWSHNDSAGPLTYNLAGGALINRRRSAAAGELLDTDPATGTVTQVQRTHIESVEERRGLNLNTRLQWRLSEAGDMLMLMPSVAHSESHADRRFTLAQTSVQPALPLYDLGQSSSDSRFTIGRLNTQWRQRLSASTRLELNGGVALWRAVAVTARDEFRLGQSTPLRHNDDASHAREKSANLTLKLSSLLGGDEARDAVRDEARGETRPGSAHSVVSGLEVEGVKRNESRTSLQNGVPLLTDFGDDLQASSLRVAGYAQDEWNLSPSWAVHAGLRWEGIHTRGDAADGTRPSNRSSVWTPLVHLLWKPDPKKRDQIRASLTRSYRSPLVQQLVARPALNSRYPAGGANQPTAPDSAGNPGLKPELASGLDLAFERYLDGGGVLSANLFHRRINNLMRNVTALESVSYSPVQRWVSRPQNIGGASTQGIELEAKYRLDQLIAGALRVELRHNLSLYRSRVQGVPGPNNRLDSQSPASANIGADYRLRGLPLTLGGNLNWVPGYSTRLAAERSERVSSKRVFDSFALWTISPTVGLRLLASNLAPRDYESSSQFDSVVADSSSTSRELSRSFGSSYTNLQLRLELKL